MGEDKEGREGKNRRTPCADCPYRRDAPLGHWHPEEFEKVRQSRADERAWGIGQRLSRGTFACHKHAKLPEAQQSWCAGWALMQKAEGVPSLALRLQIMTDDKAAADFSALTADGVELYGSPEEMIAANKAVYVPAKKGRGRK